MNDINKKINNLCQIQIISEKIIITECLIRACKKANDTEMLEKAEKDLQELTKQLNYYKEQIET